MDQNLTLASAPRHRWPIAFLLAFGVVVAFFDRVNLSVSQSALNASFGISTIVFGYLSSAYSWTYALMQVPCGVLLDRFGVRRVGLIGTFLWSVASFAAAISSGVGGFIAARFLLGVGEGPTFPANAKAIGLWFPPSERSLAMALTDGAAKFSTAIGVPFLGILLLHFGWRWSFAATGFISLFYFGLFWAVYRNPEENEILPDADRALVATPNTSSAHSAELFRPTSVWYWLKNRKVCGLALGWGAYNYTFFLLLAWIPSYLLLAFHLDLLHSVFYTSVPWLFATFTDLAVGGWLVDALIKRGWNPSLVRQTVLLGGTILGLGMIGTAHAHSLPVALFWISVSLGGLAAAAPVAWTVPSLIAPGGSVGTVAGIANLAGQIGAISAPIVTGYIVTATQSFSSAFVTASIILLGGVSGYIFLLGRMEPVSLPL